MAMVYVSHCRKCGEADAIWLGEDAFQDDVANGTWNDEDWEVTENPLSTGCSNCGYGGEFGLYELSAQEAIEAGWLDEENTGGALDAAMQTGDGFADQKSSWTDGLRSLLPKWWGG